MLVSQTKLHLNISYYTSPLKGNTLGTLEMLNIYPEICLLCISFRRLNYLFCQVTDHMKNSFFQRKYTGLENGLRIASGTKILVLFSSVIPVRHVVYRKAVWFSAISQARNPKLQEHLCHYLAVTLGKVCNISWLWFPHLKNRNSNPCTHTLPGRSWGSILILCSKEVLICEKVLQKCNLFSEHIQKTITLDGVIGLKINASWSSGYSCSLCPPEQLLFRLVWGIN